MNSSIKAIIVFLVLLLSAGPFLYFFGQGVEEPSVIPEEELPYVTLGVTMSAEIIELEDYLIYNGISAYNNVEYIHKILNESLKRKDYSISFELNKLGEGYSYHIKVPINPKENLEDLGFNLAFELQPFFTATTSNLPIRMGTVQLPNKLTLQFEDAGNKSVEFGELTSKVVVLYWQKEGETIAMNCPAVMFNKEDYTFLKNNDICYDITPTEEYGLTTTAFDLIAEKTSTHELKINVIKGAYFETEERADTTINDIFDALSDWYSEINMRIRHEDGKFKIDLDYINENATVDYVQTQLNSLNLKIIDSFKEANVILPHQLKVNGIEYSTRFMGMQRAKIKIDTKLWDEKKFNAYTKSKYDQLLSIRVEEVGV